MLIDWCPQCHGMWLDRGEFEDITNYLKKELLREHPKDIEREIGADLKRVWSGGPESRLDEALDAKAAVSALLSTSIFEHPALFNLCMKIPRF